jgi:hypothetical protein
LHGIDAALKECAEVKGIKMLLLRNGLVKKVRQYDAKLSVILQVHQVCRKYHDPFRSLKTFLQANVNFFVLLSQLTQEQEGGWL